MISVQNLRKDYGATSAVQGISFDIGQGEVVGLLGPNGAGKSTTLRILAGCLPPSAGSVRLAGWDVVDHNLEVRRHIGYLPENNPLYEEMDVSEYLEWVAQARGLKNPDRTGRIRYAVEACGLGDVLGKQIGVLSKGYRQRVGLAAAILHDPEILLLDEPTSGLDPNQARQVRDMILRLKERKTVLLSTHILPEVQASCDRVVIIHRGAIAAMGTPTELARSAAGRATIRVTLKYDGLDPEAVRRALMKIPGVENADCRRESGELRLTVKGKSGAGDLREPLFRMAVDKNWTMLQLHQEDASLDSVFRELTLK